MRYWRIREKENGYGVMYVLQKRILGFLWWYNPDNIDAYQDGYYNTEQQARDAYERKTAPTKTRIISI